MPRRTTAFSLIELLVVMALVTLLVAILLPALGQSREVALQVACASNQRQVLLGASVYAQDYRYQVPLGYTSQDGGSPRKQGNYWLAHVAGPVVQLGVTYGGRHVPDPRVFDCTKIPSDASAARRSDYFTDAGIIWSAGPGDAVRYSMPTRPVVKWNDGIPTGAHDLLEPMPGDELNRLPLADEFAAKAWLSCATPQYAAGTLAHLGNLNVGFGDGSSHLVPPTAAHPKFSWWTVQSILLTTASSYSSTHNARVVQLFEVFDTRRGN